METNDIGKRIKNCRKRKGLTLQELAERSSVSATAISAIERNVSSPTVNTLASIGRPLENPVGAVGETETRYVLTRRGNGRRWRRSPAELSAKAWFRHPVATVPAGPRNPRAGSGKRDGYLNRQGEDFLLVLRGALNVDADGASLPSRKGRAVPRKRSPYRWSNGSEGETLLLLVSSP